MAKLKENLAPTPLDAKTLALRKARLEKEAADKRAKRRPDDHHVVLGLEDELPFGKHKGKTIEYLLVEEIGYITWLLENTHVQFSDEVEREYRSFIR